MRLLPVLLLCLCSSALAVVETYRFDSEAQRERYNRLVDELRCPKCQNQNLAGSDAPIAADLRQQVYRLISEGKTDEEITDFMLKRYGDFVLYRPRVTAQTLALWFGPLVLLGIGVVVWWRLAARQRRGPDRENPDFENPDLEKENAELSDSERAELARLLEERGRD